MAHKIPTYKLNKSLGNLTFLYTPLEESYQKYDASHPHRHDYYEILFFNENGGIHEVDFSTYEIRKNTLHIISPDQVHRLQREAHVTGSVISFTNDFYNSFSGKPAAEVFSFLNNLQSSPVIETDEVSCSKIIAVLKEIQTEYQNTSNDHEELLFHLLSLLLIQTGRIYKHTDVSGKVTQRSHLTIQFKRELEKHFLKRLTVGEYAALLSITAGHLNETVQKDTGKTASVIIQERTLLEAKRILYHSVKSVKEIASHLGFEDPSYFTRFFRSHEKMTPEQFRKSTLEKYQ